MYVERVTVFVVACGTVKSTTLKLREHFVEFVPGDTLMTLRLATKGWKAAADAFIDEGVESGAMMVHGGKDMRRLSADREERCKLVTRVIFFLDITKVGRYACYCTTNLVVVDIPEGVERIGDVAFSDCTSLTTVSFQTTLTSIGGGAFCECSGLETVDLLHTSLQELGQQAFDSCSNLTSMTILDSLQISDYGVFLGCFKLVPSSIGVSYDDNDDPTHLFDDSVPEVVAHLHSQQTIAPTEP